MRRQLAMRGLQIGACSSRTSALSARESAESQMKSADRRSKRPSKRSGPINRYRITSRTRLFAERRGHCAVERHQQTIPLKQSNTASTTTSVAAVNAETRNWEMVMISPFQQIQQPNFGVTVFRQQQKCSTQRRRHTPRQAFLRG